MLIVMSFHKCVIQKKIWEVSMINVTSTSLEEQTSGYGLWQGSKLVLAPNAPSRPAHYSEIIPLPLLGANPETFFLTYSIE